MAKKKTTKKQKTVKTVSKKTKKIISSKPTLIAIVLDESGSMMADRDKTISAYNEYVNSVRNNTTGDVKVTLTKFQKDQVDVCYNGKPIKDVPALGIETYRPDGGTPLYDALGQTISETERVVKNSIKKPSVLLVIITDGEENASREYTREQIVERLNAKQKDGWTLVYLGANQDAMKVGASIGVATGNTMNYATAQVKTAMRSLSDQTTTYIRGGSVQTMAFFTPVKKEKDQN